MISVFETVLPLFDGLLVIDWFGFEVDGFELILFLLDELLLLLFEADGLLLCVVLLLEMLLSFVVIWLL